MTRLTTLVQPGADLERLWAAERDFLAALRHLAELESSPALAATVAELRTVSEEIVRQLEEVILAPAAPHYRRDTTGG